MKLLSRATDIFSRPAFYFPFLFFLSLGSAVIPASGGPRMADINGIRTVRVPVTADTTVSSVSGEQRGNKGDAPVVQLKGRQEMLLIRPDFRALGRILTADAGPAENKKTSGYRIASAHLHLRSASPVSAPLLRLGISTVSARWTEGRSTNFQRETGAASFRSAAENRRPWAMDGGNILDVIFGEGHSQWISVIPAPPDERGWQTMGIPPDLIYACLGGLSDGLCVYDDIGSDWRIHSAPGKPPAFHYRFFPNRKIYSSESIIGRPWVEVRLIPSPSRQPVEAPGPVHSFSDLTGFSPHLLPGEALLTWKSAASPPSGDTHGRIQGFDIALACGKAPDKFVPLARRRIPTAGGSDHADAAENTIRLHLRRPPLEPDTRHRIRIRTVSLTGRRGPARIFDFRTAPDHPLIPLPSPGKVREKAKIPHTPDSGRTGPDSGRPEISVIDLLDGFDPVSGQLHPERPEGYLRKNHLRDGKTGRIRMAGAGNETLRWQILIRAGSGKRNRRFSLNLCFPDAPGLESRIFRLISIQSKDRRLPDALVPAPGGDIVLPAGDQAAAAVCEIKIPAGFPRICRKESIAGILDIAEISPAASTEVCGEPGRTASIQSASRFRQKIGVQIRIRKFSLPDHPGFLPELNAYNTASPSPPYAYWRLAREHRACLNRLPYGWSAAPALAPKRTDTGFDWTEWDRRFSPLLTGSAFAATSPAASRRRGLSIGTHPVEVLYLPINEDWPVPLAPWYRPEFMVTKALSPEYARRFSRSARLFLSHLSEKGWTGTRFQFFLNNKIYHRKGRRDWQKIKAPWVFDEPVNIQDFEALAWYGRCWHRSADLFPDLDTAFRVDVSCLPFGRRLLWNADDLYIGRPTAQTVRMAADAREQGRVSRTAAYGRPVPPGGDISRMSLWCLHAWMNGHSGILPWNAIGSANALKQPEETALIYPAGLAGDAPVPSIRLKALTHGQQITEYLDLMVRLMEKQNGMTDQRPVRIRRAAVVQWLASVLQREENRIFSAGNDAGAPWFPGKSPALIEGIRAAVGDALEASLKDLRSTTKNLFSGGPL